MQTRAKLLLPKTESYDRRRQSQRMSYLHNSPGSASHYLWPVDHRRRRRFLISDLQVWIMWLHPAKMWIYLYLMQRYIQNTGGQCTKATPLGAYRSVCSIRKTNPQKIGYDFLRMDMFMLRLLKRWPTTQWRKLSRAEAYHGPSIVIAYAPCINHGLKKGMGKSQAEEAAAVSCGYWHLWRFNRNWARSKPAFSLDSKNLNGKDSKTSWRVKGSSLRIGNETISYWSTEAYLTSLKKVAKKRYASYVSHDKKWIHLAWSNCLI